MVVKKDNITGIGKLLYTLKEIEKFKNTKDLSSMNLWVYPCNAQQLIYSCESGIVRTDRLYPITFDKNLFDLPNKKSEYLIGIFTTATEIQNCELDYLPLSFFSLFFRNNEENEIAIKAMKEACQKYYMFRLPYTYNWWFYYCGKEGEQRWYLEDNGTEFTMFNCRCLEKEEHEKRKHLSMTSQELIDKLEDHIRSFIS